MSKATINKLNDDCYKLVVTPMTGVEMSFALSKTELFSLVIDAKNILKIENTFLNNIEGQ